MCVSIIPIVPLFLFNSHCPVKKQLRPYPLINASTDKTSSDFSRRELFRREHSGLFKNVLFSICSCYFFYGDNPFAFPAAAIFFLWLFAPGRAARLSVCLSVCLTCRGSLALSPWLSLTSPRISPASHRRRRRG